jgi:PDZ domain-containing secreted protein
MGILDVHDKSSMNARVKISIANKWLKVTDKTMSKINTIKDKVEERRQAFDDAVDYAISDARKKGVQIRLTTNKEDREGKTEVVKTLSNLPVLVAN